RDPEHVRKHLAREPGDPVVAHGGWRRGPCREVQGRTPMTNDHRKSDRSGGSASPLLANIYLHYVFDVWVQAWRKKQARGDVIVVRFADDVVLGFQSEMEAKQFQVELAERFRKFNLELHPDK